VLGSGPIEELSVAYDPSLLAQKMARRRRLLTSRLISLAITVVLIVGFYLWQQSKGSATTAVWVSLVVVLAAVAWTAVYLVGFLRARRELAGMRSGTAVRIGRFGVEVGGAVASWPEVVSIKVVKDGLGRSPRLELTRTNGAPGFVAFDQIGVHPATLDSTARAYSGGRHGVDLEALDN
jgi:hypothetical protein